MGRWKPTVRHDCLELCQRAIDRLRLVGFERVAVSSKSEAVYMALPDRHGVLRISTHRSKKAPVGLNTVVATLTFRGRSGRDYNVLECTEDAVENMIVIAVGQYMLRSAEPLPSRYHGKKGTWEDDN